MGLGTRAEGKGQGGLGGKSEVRQGFPTPGLAPHLGWVKGKKEQQAPTGSQPGPSRSWLLAEKSNTLT